VKRSIWIGWDPRESEAYAVALSSLTRRLTEHVPTHALCLSDLIERGLYHRPYEIRVHGQGLIMWDTLSDAPMSTEHANSRFLVKEMAKEGWALFMDGDMLVRDDLAKLFSGLDPKFAAYCVKHNHNASFGHKMDAQIQTAYPKKNWSSLMILNASHPSNRALTLELINSVPGRDMHAFCWLKDEEIGSLHPRWNHLVGVSPATDDVSVAHFTLGLPTMPGYEQQQYAEEWRQELRSWAA